MIYYCKLLSHTYKRSHQRRVVELACKRFCETPTLAGPPLRSAVIHSSELYTQYKVCFAFLSWSTLQILHFPDASTTCTHGAFSLPPGLVFEHQTITSPFLLQSSCQWLLDPRQHSLYPLPLNTSCIVSSACWKKTRYSGHCFLPLFPFVPSSSLLLP